MGADWRAGASTPGRIPPAKITTHTSTARKSGNNPCRPPSGFAPTPGAFCLPELKGTFGGAAQVREKGTLSHDRRPFVAVTGGFLRTQAGEAATVEAATR